ncbi:hypothetical protein D3C73_1074360 [compost metagenome]
MGEEFMVKASKFDMKHISGLSDKGEDDKIKIHLFSDRIELNNKQIISLSRVNGCEVTVESRKAERHPFQMTIGIGFISYAVGELITNLSSVQGMAIIFGIVGAIIGSRTVYRPHAMLAIEYQNIDGDTSVIRLTEDNKYRKYICEIADKINQVIGYTPITNNNSKGRYEI